MRAANNFHSIHRLILVNLENHQQNQFSWNNIRTYVFFLWIFFFFSNSDSQKLEEENKNKKYLQDSYVNVLKDTATRNTHTDAEKIAKITKMLLARQWLAVHLCGPSIEFFDQKHTHLTMQYILFLFFLLKKGFKQFQ